MASISEKMQDALNGQINAETYSSHLYLAMSAYFESIDLPGFANWMRVQAREEDVHIQKLFDYVFERSGRVILGAIEGPPAEWQSPLTVFEAAFEHEQLISKGIADLVDLAISESDRASESFLRWYVDEQVEEEASIGGIISKLKLVKDDGYGLLMIDNELGARQTVGPNL